LVGDAMMPALFRFAALPFVLGALSGCATAQWGPGVPVKPPSGAVVGPSGGAPSCVRWSSGKDSLHRQPLAGPEQDPELAAELATLPPDVRRVVLAAGLEPSLARLLRERKTAPALDQIVRRQAIELHLQSLKAQLDATIHEADCAGDLIEQLQSKLEQDESAKEIRWTVISIITQGVAAVAIGTMELSRASDESIAIVGISSGVLAAGFGVAAFAPPDPEIVLEHSRNLLTPIVRGEDPEHIYPTFVFRLLTSPPPGGEPPVQRLRARFQQVLEEEVDPDELTRARALLFGSGGIYDKRLVAARERMLDELESELTALSRDLEVLQRHLVRVLGDRELLLTPTSAPDTDASATAADE
jgi:hypothetical protein